MKLSQVVAIAKKMGVKDASKLGKTDLIRAVQIKEGNTDCFAKGKKDCGELNCLWREDCMAC